MTTPPNFRQAADQLALALRNALAHALDSWHDEGYEAIAAYDSAVAQEDTRVEELERTVAAWERALEDDGRKFFGAFSMACRRRIRNRVAAILKEKEHEGNN